MSYSRQYDAHIWNAPRTPRTTVNVVADTLPSENLEVRLSTEYRNDNSCEGDSCSSRELPNTMHIHGVTDIMM
jgi:hypothetical protein